MTSQIPLVLTGTAPYWTGLAQLQVGDRLAGVVNHLDFGIDSVITSTPSGSVVSTMIPAGTALANLGFGVTAVTMQALGDAIGAVSTIGDLADVNALTVSDGDVLKYSGTTSKFEAVSHTLNTLVDVALSSPQKGDLLAYDTAVGKWMRSPDAPSDNLEYVRRNGQWDVNSAVPEAPIDDQSYARSNGEWVTVMGGGGSGTLEQGTGFFDIPNNSMHITFGVDGSWEAIRFTSGVGDATTGPNQPGPKPTTLAELKNLTYS